MYMKSRLMFSLVKVSISTMSLSSVNVHRLPGFTLSRQARQKGHDLDLAFLQSNVSELSHIWPAIRMIIGKTTLFNNQHDGYDKLGRKREREKGQDCCA
jgi:hypothetical protein